MKPVEYHIDGVLDLHTFHPHDVKRLVPEYIEICRGKEIFQIRIIHGKGTGTLRHIVHSLLKKNPYVEAYWHEGGTGGSWGATVVKLKEK